jgi:hypothetical protein
MMSTVPQGTLLALLCLVAGCAPSPEVLRAGAGPELWNPNATKSPPPADADPTSGDPERPPAVDADPDPTPDAGGVAADAASVVDGLPRDDAAASQAPPQKCTLAFQVTTATFNGSYAPKNVGAIWVSDANARFVKSLTVWAGKRIRHLTQWQSVAMGNTVDAVTSATTNSHGTRMAKWDCTGLDHLPVANGPYRINVEFTERNGAGRVMVPLMFLKSDGAQNLMPPDQTNFKGVRLQVSTP